MDTATALFASFCDVEFGASRKSAERLLENARDIYGFDLLSFKPKLLTRRLRARIAARECSHLADYVSILEEDPAEWSKLIRALAIQYSGFFRNPRTFRRIAELVLPELMKAGEEAAGVLSAGCCRGEEIYSVAIMWDWARECRGASGQAWFKGIDIDETAIEFAEKGFYRQDSINVLPEKIKDRYFIKRDNGHALVPEIRQAVEFAAQDLLMDYNLPVTALVICRNVLIYYRREQQKIIMDKLFESLSPGGFLVLGRTESLPRELRDEFLVADSWERIYRKLGE